MFFEIRPINPRLCIPIYALTLLLSAALLFSVQPMFSKMILPLLGGTPQVWNTAMLFFQLCLLGGYAYAHGTSKYLGLRTQAILHIILLSIFIVVLPFAIPEGWTPPTESDPTLWQLGLMAMTVGGPFFILAGSAPMLQRWFSLSGHKDSDNPYFLYGASNLGSISALLTYPVIIEPLLNLPAQSVSWMYGYFGLISMTAFSAALARKTKPIVQSVVNATTPISWKQKGQWLLLAFIPSSLMLGVTTFITTDIATVPLLWILPLALYVGTFIIVFARKPLIGEHLATSLFTILLIILIGGKIGLSYAPLNPAILITLHLLTFFFAALLCHTALAKAKPDTSRLTEFYLYMSIGGALGGFFNAIIAPQLFVIPIEYGLVLALAVFVRYAHRPEYGFKTSLSDCVALFKTKGLDAIFTAYGLCVALIIVACLFSFGLPKKEMFYVAAAIITGSLIILSKKRWLFAAMISFVLLFFPLGFDWGQHEFKKILYQDRNFFGVLKVINMTDERILLHGTTNHGAQALDKKHRLTKLSYYSAFSPISDAFSYYKNKNGKQDVGVIGLGIGVTACFSNPGRHFDFFEIDPEIASIAENKAYFTYLSDCGSPYNIILGDGRLTIAKKPDHFYDIIVIDAFSSDNIPIHLLTAEAITLYMSKLKNDGTIVMNISNNFIDLEPVLAKTAEKLDLIALARVDNGGKIKDTKLEYYPSHWLVITKSSAVKKHLIAQNWSTGIFRDGVESWSDQYSNIVSVLGNKTSIKRFKEIQKP